MGFTGPDEELHKGVAKGKSEKKWERQRVDRVRSSFSAGVKGVSDIKSERNNIDRGLLQANRRMARKNRELTENESKRPTRMR